MPINEATIPVDSLEEILATTCSILGNISR